MTTLYSYFNTLRPGPSKYNATFIKYVAMSCIAFNVVEAVFFVIIIRHRVA